MLSRRHRIDHTNVTDSREVLVLASAAPATYANDPRLAPEEERRRNVDSRSHRKPKKAKKSKAKSAA